MIFKEVDKVAIDKLSDNDLISLSNHYRVLLTQDLCDFSNYGRTISLEREKRFKSKLDKSHKLQCEITKRWQNKNGYTKR